MMKMASSRVLLLCGLLLAVVVLMVAQVSARDLAEMTQSQENVKDTHHGHGEHHHGGHEGHHHGGHHGGGHPPEETEDVKN
ncbi:glycine-rich protein DC7.1-like isoform X2 [Rhodamnia argentea]|uniref:Glycine-rich protein DC7.1-like isoform X2 n=1 Tax=Rhodamnia argentea TaxID=178133 RepID=A0A8B8Q3A0_9MYRT|nr:glycine-rich protein DC7.1-like isoform X2 [Rhodamnia argentea]